MSKNSWKLICPQCGEKTKSGHLVPPSMGEPKQWICGAINRMEQEEGMPKRKDWYVVDPC